MKQSVSPVAIGVAILAVVAIVGYFGYKIFLAQDGASNLSPREYQAKTQAQQQQQQSNMDKMKTHGPSGAPIDYRTRQAGAAPGRPAQ